MSERDTQRRPAPPCPICSAETDIKQIHREASRDVVVYKCRSCSVEYPVVTR